MKRGKWVAAAVVAVCVIFAAKDFGMRAFEIASLTISALTVFWLIIYTEAAAKTAEQATRTAEAAFAQAEAAQKPCMVPGKQKNATNALEVLVFLNVGNGPALNIVAETDVSGKKTTVDLAGAAPRE